MVHEPKGTLIIRFREVVVLGKTWAISFLNPRLCHIAVLACVPMECVSV